MAELIGWAFLLLYIFSALRILTVSVQTVVQYIQDQKRPFVIVPDRIAAFEQRRTGTRSHRRTVFYPVFEYQWKGKTRRGFARRAPAAVGPGLTLVPRTRLNVGDAVDVRVYPQKISASHIDEPHYFWRARIWGMVLAAAAGGMMLVFGVYSAICRLVPGNA